MVKLWLHVPDGPQFFAGDRLVFEEGRLALHFHDVCLGSFNLDDVMEWEIQELN